MNLKKLLIALLALVAVFACNQAEPVVEPVLEVGSVRMVYNSSGGERLLTIMTNNAWTIEADVDWVSFAQNSGEASDKKQQVRIIIDEYPVVNADPRLGKITVKSAGLAKEIEVIQSAAEFVADLSVSEEELVAPVAGGAFTFTVTSNVAWTAAVPEAAAEWITVTPASGEPSEEAVTVTVTVEANETFAERTAEITVSGEGVAETVTVSQGFNSPITLSATSLEAVAEGEEVTFTVTSKAAWTAAVPAGVDWITLAPAGGEASETAVTVTATVLENPLLVRRTAVITVTAAGIEETVTLVQAPNTPKPEAMEGSGTEADPYLIKTVGNMLAVRQSAPVGATTYFRMENDIDMSQVVEWVPINNDEDFGRQIHFDGNNKTISNFKCDKSVNGAAYSSLFGVLYGSCKNLKVDNAEIISTAGCGVIGGYVGTTDKPAVLENVTITNSSVTNEGDRCGGVCGTAKEATIKNVSFSGTVTSDLAGEAKSGGFVGQTQTSATFENCSVDVVFVGKGSDIGGFAGKLLGEVAFTGCKAKVVISSSAAQKNRCGGFVGWNSSAKATFTDCHVLKGSSVKDLSNRTTATNGNYGGFIGFGDAENSDLEISGCSAEADVDGGNSQLNSCFISYLGYASKTTITDSYAAGNLKTTLGNNTGGLVGATEASAELVMTNCHYSGTVDAVGSYVGGIIGGAKGKVTLSQTYSTGLVKAVGGYVGGLFGASMNDAVVITNCFSTAEVRAFGQQAGGLVGTTTNMLTMSDCYASGDIYSATSGAAGIVGRVAKSSSITNCIAWNKNVSASRSAKNVYAPGAILGCAQENGTYKGCVRRYDMILTDDFMTLSDQEDIVNAMPPLPSYSTDTHQQSYHGKAAAPGATLASVAKSLGWDESIWNFASNGSGLGYTIKQLGDNKIEF